MSEKTKVMLISDHPLVPSGVGTQARYLIEGLWKTGRYKFVCLGGAVKHPDMRPQKVEPEKYGDDWIVFPVEGYGNRDVVRQVLAMERPDVLLFITDPRFYYWLWEMEDEVRQTCPMVYWHVWDNDPTPDYNRVFYESTDRIAAISLKTLGILEDLDYKGRSYIPHGVSPDLFKPVEPELVDAFKRANYGPHAETPFIVFWNNRNARRKVTGDVIASFAKFLDKVGHDAASLMMHTSPKDPEGQDVLAVAQNYGVEKRLIISDRRLESHDLNMFYNVADCTLNIASNEGFGLSTLESLYAGTPIVAHFTGGLQFQTGDWWHDDKGNVCVDLTDQDAMTTRARKMYNSNRGKWWGVPVFPASRSCTGSQQIPYIYDDRVAHEDVVDALMKIYKMSRTARKKLGHEASAWARKHFSLEDMVSKFDSLLSDTIGQFRSEPRSQVRLASL